MYQNQTYQCTFWKQNLCFFRELLSLRCCGGQKLLGSLHQLLLVERKEMKEASGDGPHIFYQNMGQLFFSENRIFILFDEWNERATSKQNMGSQLLFCIANSVSRILALSSHSVCPCVRPQAWHPSISPLYDILDHTNQIFSESLWRPLPTHPPPLPRYPNINTQIHKYTNTTLVKVEHRHNMCYIFEKVMVRGPQK